MPDPDEASLLGATMSPDDFSKTWRQRVGESARRRGIPLGTILTTVLVTIGVIDLNIMVVVLFWVLRTIVLYAVVATFIAVVLAPPTRAIKQRFHVPHGVAASIVFFVTALIFIGVVVLFATPLVTNAGHFPNSLNKLIDKARNGKGQLGHLVYRFHLQKYLANGATKLTTQLKKLLQPALALKAGTAAISTLTSLVIIAILSFFSLLEAPRLWAGFLSLFNPVTAARLQRVYNETSRSVTGYVIGNALTSIIAGVIVFVTLTILGVPFAPLLGVWVALVDLLPLIGGLLAGVPVIIIALFHSVPAGIVMFIVFIAYQQLENHVLNPIIMSKTVRLNPLWVLLAVLIGATLGERIGSGLGAFIGALIGIPIGGAIQVVVRELRQGPEMSLASASAELPRDEDESESLG
jgi:predicted PurR-regulated permease PerM